MNLKCVVCGISLVRLPWYEDNEGEAFCSLCWLEHGQSNEHEKAALAFFAAQYALVEFYKVRQTLKERYSR